jgi:hypothetical protein
MQARGVVVIIRGGRCDISWDIDTQLSIQVLAVVSATPAEVAAASAPAAIHVTAVMPATYVAAAVAAATSVRTVAEPTVRASVRNVWTMRIENVRPPAIARSHAAGPAEVRRNITPSGRPSGCCGHRLPRSRLSG